MDEKDPLLKITLLGIFVVILGVGITFFMITKSLFFFLGFLLPLMTFFIIFVLMGMQRKKILKNLNESFGQNVVKISSAIMDYFELPLTLLLSVTLTIFFFAFSVLAALFWLNYLGPFKI